MNWLYNNVVLPAMKGAFRFMANFDSKIKRGLEGRHHLLQEVKAHYANLAPDRKRIWIHVASFGELEQAKPIIEAIRERGRLLQRENPPHIHLTFFSPSGYENARDKYTTPDLITYSPFDHNRDVEQFVEFVRPELVLFAKYDVWPNAINALANRQIPSVLFSATLGQDSGRFLPVVRDFDRRVYSKLSKILVIRESDKAAFTKYGIDQAKVEVAGDTRFDQVLSRQMRGRKFELPNQLLHESWSGKKIVVMGSVWLEDVLAIATLIKRRSDIAWIVIPHEVEEEKLSQIVSALPMSVKLSKLNESELSQLSTNVLIIDSIGKLFDLYSIADIVYVGGGFGKGVHNTLEAAVYGKPAVVGPRHRKTKEVQELIDAGGAVEASLPDDVGTVIEELLKDDQLRTAAGLSARRFVKSRGGATNRIMNAINGWL